MKKLKIYLDTSAIGYLDEQSSPAEMADMHSLWELLKKGVYDAVISQVTLDEIMNNRNIDKVETLLNYLGEINYEKIEISKAAIKIADLVARVNVLAEKHRNDRLHIGCAVAGGCDVIVSLNFKHLVNVKTIKGVRGIADLEGYGNIDIVSPVMLISEGDESDMNVAEVREIRETIYERTKGFTYEELYDYYAKGAERAEQRIAEIRKEKGIVFKRLNE